MLSLVVKYLWKFKMADLSIELLPTEKSRTFPFSDTSLVSIAPNLFVIPPREVWFGIVTLLILAVNF